MGGVVWIETGFGLLEPVDRLVHLGPSPWRDAVDSDAVAAKFFREDESHRDDAALGRSVVELSGTTEEAALTGGVDDAARTQRGSVGETLCHRPPVFARVMGGCRVTLEVDIDDEIPLVFGHREAHGVSQKASIVDDDVELAEAVESGFDESAGGVPVGDVALVSNGDPTAGGDGLGDLDGRVREVVHHDRGSLCSEQFCVASADALSCSCDNRDFAVECTHVGLPGSFLTLIQILGSRGYRYRVQSARPFTSVSIPVGRSEDRDVLADRARRAEALGIDAVFVTDHPAPPTSWLERSGHPTLDPFVVLSFIAAATTTLRVHTNLLVLPYRHPLTTAKAVASLDSLSHGRLILGVGVGYLAEEFAALGLDVDERGAMMEDALIAMRQAWEGEPFGQYDTVVAPVPAQHPHPPIWVGGNSRAAMRRAVLYGQGWSPMPSPKAAASVLGTPGIESVDELGARIAMLHEIAAAEGRTDRLDVAVIPTSLSGFAQGTPVSTTDVLEEIADLRSVGATALVVSLPDDGWDDRIEWLANKVLAKI